jgi:cob(I)alamin adenosyltransferase
MTEAVIVSAILGIFGLLITYFFNHQNRTLANDKMEKDLFTEFNARYDELNDFLFQIQANCKTLEDLESNPLLRYKLNDFFNLCAEEYYWKKKKRISDEIWLAWSEGMNDWYNSVPLIQLAWLDEVQKRGCKSYYIKRKDEFFKSN